MLFTLERLRDFLSLQQPLILAAHMLSSNHGGHLYPGSRNIFDLPTFFYNYPVGSVARDVPAHRTGRSLKPLIGGDLR